MKRILEGLRGSQSQSHQRIYLIYVDESGTPSFKRGRYYILLSLVTPSDASEKVVQLGRSVLTKLRNYGYNHDEIKGYEVYKLFKKVNDIGKYVNIVGKVAEELNKLGSLAIIVVIDKKAFKEDVLSKFRNHLDAALAKPPIGYLNVFSVRQIRNIIINSILEDKSDLIIRAQSVNELLVRIQKELEHLESQGIVFFDAEAATLAQSTYGIFAEALREEGLAYVKGGLGRPDRILYIGLTKSSLDYGIQLADLLVNALYNCIVYNMSNIYKYISVLLSDKGLTVLPKKVKICE
ncbi:MAG: DUF3800 domain-containing protein [Desulfurococcales archaeon]|nr:DUF3800 domain-containing protein [Desulfurococcales archaeon]